MGNTPFLTPCRLAGTHGLGQLRVVIDWIHFRASDRLAFSFGIGHHRSVGVAVLCQRSPPSLAGQRLTGLLAVVAPVTGVRVLVARIAFDILDLLVQGHLILRQSDRLDEVEVMRTRD